MENIKWLLNQGVAVFALVGLLWIEYKRAGGISKMPTEIERLREEIKELKEMIDKYMGGHNG